MLAVSLLVVRGSYAVFSDTTDNTANNWVAGTVTLSNDPEGDGSYGDATTAEFNASLLVPGDAGTGCIDVRYDGTVISATSLTNVVLYTANLTDIDGGSDSGDAAKLSDDVDIDVNIYAAGEDCSTASPTRTEVFASAPLDTMPTSYATGIDSAWKPSATSEVRAFEFNWTFGSDTANDAQGDAAQIDFVWEIQTS
jgi:hypothetical protein